MQARMTYVMARGDRGGWKRRMAVEMVRDTDGMPGRCVYDGENAYYLRKRNKALMFMNDDDNQPTKKNVDGMTV